MHLEPPSITLVIGGNNGKTEKYFVILKLCRYPTSSMSDLYEFKMSLFDNGKPKYFFLFVRQFNMTLAELWFLEVGAKV